MKKIFYVVFLFCSILLFNNQVYSITLDDKLLRVKINCGQSSGGKSGWYDSFFATSTEHTFQGSRYWGGGQGIGDVGYEIFSVFKTKKRFIVKGKGRYAKKGDRWEYRLKSEGDMSITEHLSKGLTGTRGKNDWRRKCVMQLADAVLVREAMASKNIHKNYLIAIKQRDNLDDEVKKLEKEIFELKKQVSLLNSSLESEEKNKRLTEEKLKEQEQKQKIAEEKLKEQEQKQKTAEEKLKELKEQEQKQKISEEKLKEQEKDQKIAEEKLKKLQKDQKISEEKRLLEELKQKIADEKKKIKELNKQIE